jgi:hypothetical protein
MIPVEYNVFYKAELPLDRPWSSSHWDVFISAYNSSERVQIVFNKVPARKKYWLIHNEYEYKDVEFPSDSIFRSDETNEAPFVRSLVARLEADIGKKVREISICIDVTGFMRPHLLFLALYLNAQNVKRYDVLYSEPVQYRKKELTTFSEGSISVRQIAGFEGLNSSDQSGDFLIVGSGYDHRLIKAVAEKKDKADKVQIFGLPSLRADMYQENVLRAFKASDAIGTNKLFDVDRFFAPANDPFVTAATLSEIVRLRERYGPISNLYLSPLATKPQALGFALFYLAECVGKNASILFPISTRYERETSTGLSRVWQYTVQYPIL